MQPFHTAMKCHEMPLNASVMNLAKLDAFGDV